MKLERSAANSLLERNPEISTTELLRQLTPPPEFQAARFENYRPDANFPSQAAALASAQQFVTPTTKGLFSKPKTAPGLYFDGGFGVGKTHLLASVWHAYRGKKAFGAFLEYTSLVGYLGFAEAVNQLSKFELVCIDEFELDDPGDTMILSRLLKELEAKGVRFAATSNTPPNALGQGRFAAEDFKREIQGLGERFEILTVDGEDFRHRDVDADSRNLSERELANWISTQQEVFHDEFDLLLGHLATIHPTKFRALLSDVGALAVSSVHPLSDQVAALRWVSFIDRLYEQQIPLRTSGEVPATKIFDKTMLEGGYRKKYLRSVSRMGALCALY
jgi:cell division protein ZapE